MQHPLDPSVLPPEARKVIVRNVTSGDSPWVLFALHNSVTTCIPSKDLTRKEWLDIFSVVRDQIRDSLGNEIQTKAQEGDPE